MLYGILYFLSGKILNNNMVSLPKVISKSSKSSRTKQNNDLSTVQVDFLYKMSKINEIKIYLKQNFKLNDLEDHFLSILDEEYAIQYLEKMGLVATKLNIAKLLKIKSLDKCEFQLSVDTVRGKQIKVLHVFPNNPNKKQTSVNTNIPKTNEEFEKLMGKSSLLKRETEDDKLNNIKNRPLLKEDIYLYVPEVVDNIINKAKEAIDDRRLYFESHGLIEQQVKGFDLSIENIRKKYLTPNQQTIIKVNDLISGKAKFQNIEKVKKAEIVNNPKFEFPFLDINLTKDILKEVNKPIEVKN